MATKSKKVGVVGEIYLLHFDRKYAHAQHYLGWALDHKPRVENHRKGRGAKLTRAAADAGIGMRVARVWRNVTRFDERRLHRWNNNSDLCPVCRAAASKN
jgi:hypothetical protein